MSVEIGSFLRQARESAGLSLDEVQEKTRIQKNFLTAIEIGDFDKLPSPYYVRNYLRAYANCVKVEPHHILRHYRKEDQEKRYGHHRNGDTMAGTMTDLSATAIRKAPTQNTGQFSFAEHLEQLQKTGSQQAVQEDTSKQRKNRTSLHTALTIANSNTSTLTKPMTMKNNTKRNSVPLSALSDSQRSEEPAQEANYELPVTQSGSFLNKTYGQSATKTSSRNTNKMTAATATDASVAAQPDSAVGARNPYLASTKLPTINRRVDGSKVPSVTRPLPKVDPVQMQDTIKLPPNQLSPTPRLGTERASQQDQVSLDRFGRDRLGTERISSLGSNKESSISSGDSVFLNQSRPSIEVDEPPTGHRRNTSRLPNGISEMGKQTTNPPSGKFRGRAQGSENTDRFARSDRFNTSPRVSEDVMSMKPPTRNEAAQHRNENRKGTKKGKAAPIYTKNWFLGTVAGVIILPLVAYFVFAGGDDTAQSQEQTTEVPAPIAPDSPETKSASQDGGSEQKTDGAVTKERDGVYLISSDQVELVFSPNGGRSVVVITNASGEKEEFTLNSKDPSVKRSLTLNSGEKISITLGAPEYVETTVNGVPVKPGGQIIRLQKK
ncbi:helix-turn-helix domain-containing protein [Risungbinella massiliensis]|uniref:helix-turn-helix domain-containing protein n=1 Tax=Risungbinella massiliensis TaxID=1329796 RepID=UPI0005CB9E86|nr:helix-turn-helix domain-containing protein [Risungbinella massiliensis]